MLITIKLLSIHVRLILLLLLLEASESIHVHTDIGWIRGRVSATILKGTVLHAFEGIPYAEPPVRRLRFRPPEPNTGVWKIWNGTRQRSSCIRIELGKIFIKGHEDCLHLNIYTTAIHRNKTKLPVVVWIHGGFFFDGSTSFDEYGLDYFIDRNIVSVSIHYRLGFLGFYRNDRDIHGNMGIKDQLMALRWINKNIEAFGGDHQKVTIMGESAGAVCVTYLVQSPLASGLFQRAIVQSGNSLAGWAYARNALPVTKIALELYSMLLQCIDLFILEGVMKALSYFPKMKMYLEIATDPLDGFLYAPVQERPSRTAIFLKNSYDVLDKCQRNSFVPILIGHTINEGRTIVTYSAVTKAVMSALSAAYKLFYERLLPRDIRSVGNCSRLGQKVKQHYRLNTPSEISHFIGDLCFVLPTVRYVKMFSKCNDVYYYSFSYRDAGHGDDLHYQFSNYQLAGTDADVSEDFMTFWSNFIKYGKPGRSAHSWPKAQKANHYTYMNIDVKHTLHTISEGPHAIDLAFWQDIYAECGVPMGSGLPLITRQRGCNNKLVSSCLISYVFVILMKLLFYAE